MAITPVRKIGNYLYVESEWFVARITAIGSLGGTAPCQGIPHAWIEQKLCANGLTYVNGTESVETGSIVASDQPAYPINGGQASVGDLVLMRPRGIGDGVNPVLEFMSTSGGGGGASGVTSVQCTGGNLVVTYS